MHIQLHQIQKVIIMQVKKEQVKEQVKKIKRKMKEEKKYEEYLLRKEKPRTP